MFDQHRNLAIGTIITAPSPADSGTTLTLNTSEGTNFAANMPITICPVGQYPSQLNAGIGYVT